MKFWFTPGDTVKLKSNFKYDEFENLRFWMPFYFVSSEIEFDKNFTVYNFSNHFLELHLKTYFKDNSVKFVRSRNVLIEIHKNNWN